MSKTSEQKMHHSPICTSNTKLASALNALGIEMQAPFWTKITDHKTKEETITWIFNSKSNCGKYNTREYIKIWDSDEWFLENFPKKHPFALIICAMETREYLVDKIKESKGHIKFRKNKKDWIVVDGSDLHKKLLNDE